MLAHAGEVGVSSETILCVRPFFIGEYMNTEDYRKSLDKDSDQEIARKVFMLMFEFKVIPEMRRFWGYK